MGKMTLITEEDELNIIKDYIENKMPRSIVCAKYKIRQQRFYAFLKKYGHVMRKSNDTRVIHVSQEEIDKIVEIYNKYKSAKLAAKFINKHPNTVKKIFKKLGIAQDRNHILDSDFKSKWILLYGEEIANKMYNEYLQKQSIASKGENNPMYGKPSPNGAGHGWKGWYKDFYFRSLREVSYLIYLDEQNIRWESAENKRFTIKYINYDNSERTYRPDFFLPELKKLVEVKPKKLQKSPLIILKSEAAQEFCSINNLTYEILDFPIDANKIKIALESKLIKFDRDYEKKFLNYLSPKKN